MAVLDLATAKHFPAERENGEKSTLLVVENVRIHSDVLIRGARLFEDRFCYISHLKGSTHPSL